MSTFFLVKHVFMANLFLVKTGFLVKMFFFVVVVKTYLLVKRCYFGEHFCCCFKWFVKISLRHRHAPMVQDCAFSHIIDYVTFFQKILNGLSFSG